MFLWNFNQRRRTEFINYTRVLSNNATLLGLPNAARNLFPIHYHVHVLYRKSKSSFYGISVSQMTTDMFYLSLTLPGPFLIHDLQILDRISIKYAPNANRKRNERKTNERFTRTIRKTHDTRNERTIHERMNEMKRTNYRSTI